MSAKEEQKPPTTQSDGKDASSNSKGRQSGSRRFAGNRNISSAFKGDHSELQGSIYTIDGGNRADKYQKTTEKIAQYVEQECKDSGDLVRAMETLEEFDFAECRPDEPDDVESLGYVEKMVLDNEVKQFVMRTKNYKDNKAKVFSIVFGQCTEALRAELEVRKDWDDVKAKRDLVSLLKAVKARMLNQQKEVHPYVAAHSALRTMFIMRQGRHESDTDYVKRFRAQVDVLESMGINIGALVESRVNAEIKSKFDEERDDATNDQIVEAEGIASGKLLSIMLLLGSHVNTNGGVARELSNSFLTDRDLYPTTIPDTQNLLFHYKPLVHVHHTGANDGINFAMTGGNEWQRGRPRRDRSNDTCNRCGEKGHHGYECPKNGKGGASDDSKKNEPKQGTANIMTGDDGDDDQEGLYMASSCFHQSGTSAAYDAERTQGVLARGSVGIDSMSDVDVFRDGFLLTDIREVDIPMRIKCSAGHVTVNMMGHLKGYGDVWYDPNGIANILSLFNVQEKLYTIFGGEVGNRFIVVNSDGVTRSFVPTRTGLYVSSFDDRVALVSTVADNMKQYTKRDVEKAKAARELYIAINRPSEAHFKKLVGERLIPNCTITVQDIDNARAIFGVDIGALKGKSTRATPPPVKSNAVPVPPALFKQHQRVVIAADIMYVNGIAFFVSISHKIRFASAEAIANREKQTLWASVRAIFGRYKARGFIVTELRMDKEFECLSTDVELAGAKLNTTGAHEHVPEIERFIRTMKERIRAVQATLPFRRIPKRLVLEMVYATAFWWNAFIVPDGVSDRHSPGEIITGRLVDMRHCTLPFGTYVQIPAGETTNQCNRPRTAGALATRPTGNAQAGFHFYRIDSGRMVSRYDGNGIHRLPMPADVVQAVERRARGDGPGIVFGDRYGNTILAEEYEDGDDASIGNEDQNDARYVATVDVPAALLQTDDASVQSHQQDEQDDDDDDDVPILIAGVDADNPEEAEEAEANADNPEAAAEAEAEAETAGVPAETAGVPAEEAEAAAGPTGVQAEDESTDDEADLDTEMDERYGQRSGRYSLRERRPPRYDATLLTQEGQRQYEATMMAQSKTVPPTVGPATILGHDPAMNDLYSTMLAHVSMNKGIKMYGDKAVKAVDKEVRQIHDREVIRPLTLPSHCRKKALNYLMFISQKRDGTIKARGCADGRVQRPTVGKQQTASPTVSTEGLFLTSLIDAKERRAVATVDVPGAFLQTDAKGDPVYIRFQGVMVELLEMIDPKLYRKHVVVEGGKKVLYGEAMKALYGTITASLLFWEEVTAQLKKWDFEINPYDWCVANKMVNGEQLTVVWHVDDFKISHKEQAVVDELVTKMQKKWGELSPMTVQTGKVHEYLGMTLDFSQDSKVVVTMFDFLEGLFDALPAEFDGEAVTPAADHLFQVNEDAEKLPEDKAMLFHHFTMKLMFLVKRARPDGLLAIAFLCTRVKAPDVDDWKKLIRVCQYFRATKDLPLTLNADDSHVIKWWIDAAFAVHPDFKSHGGAVMSLGGGAAYSASNKTKINSRSSTEAELISANDYMPQVIWTRYFLECQGYEIKDSVVLQDNQSAMLLEKNGKGSSSKRTRHINIRYFFINDRIKAGELKVEYCPTGDMIADFFTKPLQGSTFRKFRDMILNIKS